MGGPRADNHTAGLDLVRRRTRPAIIMLDAALNVVCSEPRAIELLSRVTSGEIGEQLPPQIQSAISERIHEMRSAGATADTFVAIDNLLLRVVPVSGEAGSFIAVFVEAHAKREHLLHATKRYGLTKREGEVLSLLVRGHRGTEIADELCITPATVNDHFKSCLKKTNARTRAEMLVKIFDGS